MAGPMSSMISSCEKVTILGGTYRGFSLVFGFRVLAMPFGFRSFIVSPMHLMIHHFPTNNPAKSASTAGNGHRIRPKRRPAGRALRRRSQAFRALRSFQSRSFQRLRQPTKRW